MKHHENDSFDDERCDSHIGPSLGMISPSGIPSDGLGRLPRELS